jgi:hypothetical protein
VTPDRDARSDAGAVGRPGRHPIASTGDTRLEHLVAEAGAALRRARALADEVPPRSAEHILLRAVLQRAAAALVDAERLGERIAAPA